MNIDFSLFHFLRPLFLFLFIGLFWFAWRVYQYAKNANSWTQACDPSLLSYLLVGVEKKKGWLHFLLLIIVGSLLIFAMAGPTWSKLPQAVYKKESAKVFVLDLSRSMDATDLAPSRASRAKLKLIDFLEASKEGQSALVVYANLPHIVSPLTDDANTIVSMVPSLSTSIMPSGGGRADRAILKAAQLLTQAGHFEGEIILFTDGVDMDKTRGVAEKIASAGYQLNVIGVGTVEGSPIPLEDNGGFLKDNNGNIVIPKFKRDELKQLALSGSGIYSDITVDNTDVERLTKTLELENTMGEGLANAFSKEAMVKEVDLWRDQGHLFLLFALPFAALSFRRGWLGSLLLVSFMLPTQEVYAVDTDLDLVTSNDADSSFGWNDLWVNKNTQAQQALNEGEVKKAAELFEDPQWKGTAQYKNGNFAEAEAQFLKEDTAESYYNAGNALAQQGKLQEAIEAYNNTLEREPKHRDATFNKTLVQKIIDQQQKDQDQDSDEKSDEDSDEKKKSDEESEDGSESDQEQDSDQQKDNDQKKDKQEQSESDQEKETDEKDSQQNDSEEEKAKEEKAREEKEAKEKEQQESEEKQEAEQTPEQQQEQKEIEQATEQWLRRIPDDPGGLLREKMRRQNIRDRQRQRPTTGNQW